MSFSMAGAGARGPQINITPLIDVLLTLIIVFMVVVSMDKESGRDRADSATRSEADGQHLAAAHRRHPGAVDETRSAPDGKNQSGHRALARPGDAPRGNLPEAS